jgi:hypothetical protein
VESHLLPIDEEDALKRILRHHGAPVTRKLVSDLSDLMLWVHEFEQLKARFSAAHAYPEPLLVTLSKMGIYGREAIDKVPVAS